MRRGILPLVGGIIAAVEKPRCKLKPIVVQPGWPSLRKRMLGKRILRVDRRGKRLMVVVEQELRLVIEPRMTGLVALEEVPNQEHLRLRLRVDGAAASQLLFWDRRGLGTVRLLSPAEFDTALGSDKLGPDALDCTLSELRTRLATSRRAIKVALLDQKAVAGIGNLYASEMLHMARISPEVSCNDLSAAAWKRLHASMRKVLETAILYEGSTLSDGTYRNALNKSGEYQNHHRVYDRAGENCSRCRNQVIVRIVQAQRSTFYCPTCQAS